jgi:hypothetical protein
LIALLGAIVSGGAVAVFSGDWVCAALGAALIAAAVCGLSAWILRRQTGRGRSWARLMLVILIVALAVAQVSWTNVNLRRQALQTAFGADPSAGIRDLHVARHYAGGPGDTITLLRFNADSDLVLRLLSASSAQASNSLSQDSRAAGISAAQLWNQSFGFAQSWAGGWWPQTAPALKDPVLYIKPSAPDEMPTSSTTILWDRATGDVYVMLIVG